jgi:signal transduction histidine kinase
MGRVVSGQVAAGPALASRIIVRPRGPRAGSEVAPGEVGLGEVGFSEIGLAEGEPPAADSTEGALGGVPPEFLYRLVLESGPRFFLADCDGRLRLASDSFRELAEQIAARSGPALAELLALPKIAAELAQRDETLRDFVLPEMPRRQLSVRHRALRDARGLLVGVYGTVEELTESAWLERELAAAQERLHDVTRLVSDWVWETDADLALSFVSPRICEMLDYHPRELIRCRLADFGTFPDGRHGFPGPEGSSPLPFRDIAFSVARRDGARRLLLLSGLPVFSASGDFVGYRGTARDVTQETEAGERAAQSRGQLTRAIESISEGFTLFDAEERLVLCNSKFRSMFPATADLLEPGIAYADFIHAVAERGGVMLGSETARAWSERQCALRRQGAAAFELQLGDGRWVKVSDRRAADGSTVGILTDITELKRREAALYSAKEYAEVASRSKSEFLANISHELRTPLNAIIGFAEIMRDEIFGPVGSQQYRDYLGDILDSGRHLLDVINDILDVAKAEAGKLELDEEEVDVADVIRSAMRLVHERAHKSELTLGTEAPAQLPLLYADERKLKQILLNLLTNAIKFTPPGGRVEITTELDPSGDFVLRVADTGIGIAPEHIATALAPFGQVDGSMTRKYEGTGLGLPLTHAMVELHGGTLSIASRVRQGTTVTVRLPATRLRYQFDCGG